MSGPVRVDISDLKPVIRDLRQFDKKSGRRIAKAMKGAAEMILTDSKANAAWSKRIPGSIRLSVTPKHIQIKSGGKSAPHAANFEFGAGGDYPPKKAWKHPIFGKGKNKYLQFAKPYMIPARDAARMLSVSERTLYAMTAPRGPIASVRIGRADSGNPRVLYSVETLRAWIAAQTDSVSALVSTAASPAT